MLDSKTAGLRSHFKRQAGQPRKKGHSLRNLMSRFRKWPLLQPQINTESGAMNNTDDCIAAAKSMLATNAKSNQFEKLCGSLVRAELDQTWDAPARLRASPEELRAQQIVTQIREYERRDPELFGNLPGEAVPTPGSRDMGGRFLVNKPSIHLSAIYHIAKKIPKGAHQHLHFSTEIPPEILFPHARDVENTMFLRSTRCLCGVEDFDQAEIIFNVLPEWTTKANIFSQAYNPNHRDKKNSPWMLWRDFRMSFPDQIRSEEQPEDLDRAECWAREKMIVTRHLVYAEDQTHNGAWACFNQMTRAVKGLFNYEGIYRWYIGSAIDSMIRDNVMYAELRPMLLDKTIPSNDGTRQLTLYDQMHIICEEVAKKLHQLKRDGQLRNFPFGLKIIYCTPRSIPVTRMQTELEDCVKLKLQFPDLICGFDLVGAEDRPNSIRKYGDLLLAFTETCRSLNIAIPFMFHAGETLLDTGGSDDPEMSNLYAALALNSKRIGHGYALLKHPLLVKEYKEKNICLELCPISNELLHLCGNAREHPFPQLLAAGLHCTLNADNPSIFSSSLSHEFYQVMIGDPRMTVHGWKQLAEWSIEHSCLSPTEIREAKQIHAEDWQSFCVWVVENYGTYLDGKSKLS